MLLWITQHHHWSWEWSLAQKLALNRKDVTWWTCTECLCDKECAKSYISSNLSDARDTHICTISEHNHTKQKCWLRQGSDLEKLICNQGCTNRNTQKGSCLLLACLEWIRMRISSKQMIMQIPVQWQRNDMGLLSKNPRGFSKPKWQNLPLIRFILPNKLHKTMMMPDSRNM